MSTFFIILYILSSLWAFTNIVLYGSRPSKSFSWLIVVLLIPILGVLLYLLLGINRRKFKFFTLKKTIKRRLYHKNHLYEDINKTVVTFTSQKHIKLSNLISKNTYFKPYNSNDVILLTNGHDAFNTIFKAIATAEKFIHLEYFIFEDGELLEKLYTLFEEKINKGVEIRLIYDTIGSLSWKNKSIKRFKNIGVKIFPSMPIRFGSLLFSVNYRNHRKIIIIDGTHGFTGGMNISDKYIKPKSDFGIWDDTHLYIKGPVINALHRVFIKDYYYASKKELLLSSKYLPEIKNSGTKIVQITESGPDSEQSTVLQQYLMMINSAEKYIFITNSYFIPDKCILEALKMAVLSGIDVRIMIPKKSDSKLTKFSMFSYFKELLSVGIKIYMQTEKFIHTKSIIIDDEITSIGSGNFDIRSFEQNFETNAVIYDK